jgi:hypothetical protein
MSHSHYVVANYEILYKKFKDLMFQQQLANQTINDLVKKMELMEKKIIKLENSKKEIKN